MTAAEVARFLRVPTGTIYRWAHEDNWRREGTGRRTKYHVTDATTSYEKRRDTPATA